ncbi:hypothetical protein ACE1ET_20490 [Saccharicrinis sp. FJH62]|uniref:hypothetical protein n=1 Tax=Saccharicrinis sp. FJH62 TaxID=3344657 RepID=UPI0035D3ED8E
MVKILNLIIIALLLFNCKTEKISQEEKFVNDILFSVIRDNNELFDSSCKLIDRFSESFGAQSVNHIIDSVFFLEINDLFDMNDIKYLIIQKKNLENFELKTNDFKKRYRLIQKSKIDTFIASIEKSLNTDKPVDYWEEFDSKIGCIQGFARPLISRDKRTIIIKYFQISGPLSARGFTKVFRLINDKWVVLRDLESWVN